MPATPRHISVLRPMIAFLIICSLFRAVLAQDQSQTKPTVNSPLVTATATAERVRFTAPNAVAQLRLEIYSEAGQKVFDTELRGGSVVDWHLQDGEGQRVASGAYACLLTVRSLSGRLSQKLGLVVVDEKTAAVRQVEAAGLKTQQVQAIGPVEGNTTLAIMGENEAPAATAVTHDGTDSQLTRTRGALSFRVGDFFSGRDREQMRLTEEGALGIGTDQPEARLDVNGLIRARQGFQFADGSILNLAPQGTGLRVTLPSGATVPVSFAPNALAGTANRIPKFAPDGSSLLDSALFQDPSNGFIGWGTTTPAHPFSVRRNGATLGVHSIGELFVDRDDRTRSASLTVGTAGTLKWIFGMPFNSDGFQVYDLTNNVSRFFVDPTSGGIGLGTTTPTAGIRLEVNGDTLITTATGTRMQFGTPNGETGMSLIRPSTSTRADVRFNGTSLQLLAGAGTGAPPLTNGLTVNTLGNVGIGTSNPPISKLHVLTATADLPAIYAESPNRGVWGVSTSGSYGVYGESTGGGIGVQGVSTSNIGVGGISTSNYAVAGTSTSSIGVRGQTASTSIASPGVQGTSTGAGGVGVRGDGTTGVYGVSASGVGVTGESASGLAMYANGNAGQASNKGGFVKGMLYVNASGGIIRCYNGVTGASTGTCGFNVARVAVGEYDIVPDFQINTRFVSVTAENGFSIPGTDDNLGANYEFLTASLNIIRVTTFVSGQQTFIDAPFMIIIY